MANESIVTAKVPDEIESELVSGEFKSRVPVPFWMVTGPVFKVPMEEVPPSEGIVNALVPPLRLIPSTTNDPPPASSTRFFPVASKMVPLMKIPSPLCAVLRIWVSVESGIGVPLTSLMGPLISRLLPSQILLAVPAVASSDPISAGTVAEPSVTVFWLNFKSPPATSFTSPA